MKIIIVKNIKAINALKFLNIIVSLGVIAVNAVVYINSIQKNPDEKIKMIILLLGITLLLLNFINSKIRSLYHKGDIVNKIYNKLNDQNKDKLYNYAIEIYNNETH